MIDVLSTIYNQDESIKSKELFEKDKFITNLWKYLGFKINYYIY